MINLEADLLLGWRYLMVRLVEKDYLVPEGAGFRVQEVETLTPKEYAVFYL